MERLIWLIEFFMLADLGLKSCKCFNGHSVVRFDVLVMPGVVSFVGKGCLSLLVLILENLGAD